jgi:ActR/RegA family two-component response regulator
MTDRRRALIVEDRQDWQGILARVLDSLGWEYDVASTYDQALTLLEKHRYDLATIDPVLDNANKYNRDGVRVLVEVHKRFPDTALVVVSGSVNASTLDAVEGLPESLLSINKQEWDKERFRGMVLASLLGRNAVMGKSTVVRLFKAAGQPSVIPQNMPDPPNENDRIGVPHILIVEDRQDWQVILARTIEDEGWFWRIVPDASAALQLVRGQHHPFDVILLDLRLGDAELPLRKGEGWRLLDYLSISDKRSRVIIVSGEANRGDVATLFTNYPIGGFIDKDSFKKNELLSLIYNLTAKPKIRIQTLGMFQIWRDGEAIDNYGSPETETLLKVLLTWRGRPAPADDLLKLVFPTRVLDDPETVKPGNHQSGTPSFGTQPHQSRKFRFYHQAREWLYSEYPPKCLSGF